jgi:hypothetical protein
MENNAVRRLILATLRRRRSTERLAQVAQRSQVTIKATIAPAAPGCTVHFKVFDVDDPFDQVNGIPNVSILDPDNPTTGPDNRGAEGVALPWTTSKATEANGKARVQFTVSMQPGDNYRAGASVLSDAPAQADQTDADAADDEFVGKPGDFAEYKVPLTWSPMLTVWRKLWVERDTMQAPSSSEMIVVDAVTAIYATPGRAGIMTVEASSSIHASRDLNNYEGGEITFINCPSGADRFVVVESNLSCGSQACLPYRILIADPGNIAVWCATPGTGFVLHDDDDRSVLGTVANPRFPDGGELLTDAFKPAYILPVDAPLEYQNVVPSEEYLSAWDIDYGIGSWNDSKNLVSSANFWARLVVGAWEGSIDPVELSRDGDADPDTCSPLGLAFTPQGAEPPLTGASDAPDGVSLIFFQAIADDRACVDNTDENHNVVHEIGHGPSTHNDGGIMTEGAPKNQSTFTAQSLRKFRETVVW